MEHLLSITKFFMRKRLINVNNHIEIGSQYTFEANTDMQEIQLIPLKPNKKGRETPKTQIITIKRYKGAHSNNFILPVKIASLFPDWDNEVIGLYEDNGFLLLKKLREQDHQYRKKAADHSIAAGTVRQKRHLYLTQEQREALGFGQKLYTRGYPIKLTIDLVNRTALAIEKLPEEEKGKYPCFWDVFHSKGFYDTVQIVESKIFGPFLLPAEFIRRGNVQLEDILETEVIGNTLWIYGHDESCDICHKEIKAKDSIVKQVPLCLDCENKLPCK